MKLLYILLIFIINTSSANQYLNTEYIYTDEHITYIEVNTDDIFITLNKEFITKFDKELINKRVDIYSNSDSFSQIYFQSNIIPTSNWSNVNLNNITLYSTASDIIKGLGEYEGISFKLDNTHILTINTIFTQFNISAAITNLHWYITQNINMFIGIYSPTYSAGNKIDGLIGIDICTAALH